MRQPYCKLDTYIDLMRKRTTKLGLFNVERRNQRGNEGGKRGIHLTIMNEQVLGQGATR